MKTSFLMAGVAALALTASAASAQDFRTQSRGQYTTPATGSLNLGAIIPGAGNVNFAIGNNTHTNVSTGPSVGGPIAAGLPLLSPTNVANASRAEDDNSVSSAWHSTTVSVGNVGTAGSAGNDNRATFSLSGNVAEDCAFYTGNSRNLAFDFGQIGIYASDNTGAAAAFTMVAPAVMNFDTNLAGCNTPNTVSISKNDVRGLVNGDGGAYDTSVFQANLPYSVRAQYTASTTTTAGSLQTLTVNKDSNANSASQGAWKSNMDLLVTIPQADRALLAGNYSGNFTVTIAAN